MRRPARAALTLCAALAPLVCPRDLRAQWTYGAQAIPVFSRADPAPIDSAVSPPQ